MSFFRATRRLLIGHPIATKHAHTERLRKIYGLPVFSSDAISSVAYATEEALLILAMAGMAFYNCLSGLVIAVAILIAIVAFSYYQTIHAYPEGGGSYSVSKSNLGSGPGRVAGAALMMGYVLTVSVSISSGVAALVSAVPAAQPHVVLIACLAILFIALANLRGAKESGMIFAIPTYSFIFFTAILIFTGLVLGAGQPAITPNLPPPNTEETAGKLFNWLPQNAAATAFWWFVILRAFSGLCAAMTGVEAISNGVKAFKAPEPRNASLTLIWMAGIMIFLMLGTGWCAEHFGIVPMHASQPGYQTVLAQLAGKFYGQGSPLFYLTQLATMLILFMGANTAFADFPRLSSIMAGDGYVPRQMMSLGDRLVFQNGILVLAGVSIALVVVFQADVHLLIPLYAVGVFTAFTLSQAGMVVRWYRLGKRGFGMVVNLVGAISTGVVTLVLATTKFAEGAWVTVFAVAGIMTLFAIVKRCYDNEAKQLAVSQGDVPQVDRTVMLLLVPHLHRGVVKAIQYSKALSKDVRALHVTLDPKKVGPMKDAWEKYGAGIPLVILESPYRSLVEPVTEYVDLTLEENPHMMVTVIVPQAVPKRRWQMLLHSNVAIPLNMALSSRKNVAVTNVRYFLD